MDSKEDPKTLDQWIDDFIVIARDEIGMFNWTRSGVENNFAAHFRAGRTPYQALRAEGYKFMEDRKNRN